MIPKEGYPVLGAGQKEIAQPKWPSTLTLVRHGQARFNEQLWLEKKNDPLYTRLVSLSDTYPSFQTDARDWLSIHGWRTRLLGLRVNRKYPRTRETHEYTSPLTQEGREQMKEVGAALRERMQGKLPDAIYVGLAPRLLQSFEEMGEGWPELKELIERERQLPEKDRIIKKDSRVDEQDFGLVSTYTDPRVYYAWHPRQRRYRDFASPYRYRYPQGESINDVRDRSRQILNKIIRDHGELGLENVLIVSSTYWTLATMANIENWDDQKLLSFYDDPGKTKLKNGGVTIYKRQTPNERHPQSYMEQTTYNATAEELRPITASKTQITG